MIAVTDEDAAETARCLAREEGIFAGISSGAAVWAALHVGKREKSRGKRLVVILPRYWGTLPLHRSLGGERCFAGYVRTCKP